MSISGLRKASWYNPDTGTVVQANDIAEDGEFYTRAIEDPDDQTATGEAPYAGDESYCQLMTFDMSLLPQLKAWKQKDTRVSMVAAGVQQNIQWYERDLLKKVEGVYPTAAGRRNHINVVMERVGHGAHDIHGNVNLLAHLGTTADPWTDADNDNVADGYELQNQASKNFTSNSQIFETNGIGDSTHLNAKPVFPISGVSLVLSTTFNVLHTDSTTIFSRIRDRSGIILDTLSTTVVSTGRADLTLQTASSVYSLHSYVARVGNPSTIDSVSCSNPALRVDGSDQYVSY